MEKTDVEIINELTSQSKDASILMLRMVLKGLDEMARREGSKMNQY